METSKKKSKKYFPNGNKKRGVGLLYAWISWELALFALLFSFSIGVLAGFLPARSAAKMNPVDALRHE